MHTGTRSIVIGAICALLLVAAGVGGLILTRRPSTGAEQLPPKVLVVFALPGEDNAATAQVIAQVDTASGRYDLIETSATVVIPGTPYSALRDAYPFGGAQAVAEALAGAGADKDLAWVDVSFPGWSRLLASGVDVTLPEAFDAFDDASEHYSEFQQGPQRVPVGDLRALVNGLPYLDADSRQAVTVALASASMRSLASTQPAAGIETNLSPEQWDTLAGRLKRQ